MKPQPNEEDENLGSCQGEARAVVRMNRTPDKGLDLERNEPLAATFIGFK